MASSYTTSLRLEKPADGDTGWGVALRANCDALESLATASGLRVRQREYPSTSLVVTVAPGRYRKADGSAASLASATDISVTDDATSYVYLDNSGTVSMAASFPAAAAYVPLAQVQAASGLVTTITDFRSLPTEAVPDPGVTFAYDGGETEEETLSAYTADDESGAYTGIDNAQGGTPYATLTDLNALRTAYETLRAAHEDLRGFVTALVKDLQDRGRIG